MNSILNAFNLNRSSTSIADAYGANSQKTSTAKTDATTETKKTQTDAAKPGATCTENSVDGEGFFC